jgi:hypothetical protein
MRSTKGTSWPFIEGLLDEVHGTFFHGVHRHGNITVAGDEGQGQW